MKLNLDTGEKFNAIYDALGQYVENNDGYIDSTDDIDPYLLAKQEAAREMLGEFDRILTQISRLGDPIKSHG